jgi:DNA mismatch repair protein MSH4
LDLLVSFADLIALSSDTFVRPKLTSGGSLTIQSGRHPVVSVNRLQQLGQSFIPNDININEYQNFQVITGANGSGKVSVGFFSFFLFLSVASLPYFLSALFIFLRQFILNKLLLLLF